MPDGLGVADAIRVESVYGLPVAIPSSTVGMVARVQALATPGTHPRRVATGASLLPAPVRHAALLKPGEVTDARKSLALGAPSAVKNQYPPPS